MEENHSMDQVFVRKLTAIVLANLQNENFGVNELSREAGTSRSTVNRKLKSILNLNTGHFIRNIRLDRAMELLRNNQGTAAEIAYKVGFGSATYFNKCFHEYYGFPPGEVKNKGAAELPVNHENGHPIMIPVEKGTYQVTEDKPVSKNKHLTSILTISLIIISGLILLYVLYYRLSGESEHGKGTRGSEKSIVVLPFKNLSNNIENQYFADGIMEDILNNLFLIKSLNVRSRTTAEHFRDNHMTSPQIAKELSVNYVLEGSVLREEDNFRIFIQLIDARNDKHILSEKFEGDIANQLVLSADIAKKVADALEAVLSSEEIGQIEKLPTRSPEAYDNYLRGRFLFNKANDEQRVDIDREGLLGSARFYEKAITLDSTFAEAYAGLADAWFTVSAWGWHQPYYEGIGKAKEFSGRALELDPDCAEAHLVKGAYLVWPERQWEEGRKEMLRAIQLNPNSGYAHQVYAQLLMITGPIEESRLHMERVIELEPYFWVMHNLNAWVYYFEGRPREAVEACKTARELKDDWIITNWLFFINYAKLGDGENSVRELQNIANRNPEGIQFDGEIIEAFKKSGIPGLFEWITEINTNNPIPVVGLNGDRFFTSWWYAIMGNREKSLYWLERNMESERRNYTYFNIICTNPDFDILRADPRFLKIIDEIGLTPYNTRKAK